MKVALNITTERLKLRPIAAEDFPHWRDFYATDHSRFVGGPKDEEAAWRKMTEFLGHWPLAGFGYYSIETHGGDYVGRVGLDQAIGWPEPELGWALLPAAVGNGYATEAATAVLADTWSALRPANVVSFIAAGNVASERVAERLGASREAPPRYACPFEGHDIFLHQTPVAA